MSLRDELAQDGTTIAGLTLLSGGIVGWLLGRVPLADLGVAVSMAVPLIAIQQRATSATTNVTAKGPLTVKADAAAIATSKE